MSKSDDDPPAGMVSLSAAIDSLRDELSRLASDEEQQALRFRPTSVELTLETAVTASGKGSGGVHWWLIDIGGEVARQSMSTQTLRLTLEPVAFGAPPDSGASSGGGDNARALEEPPDVGVGAGQIVDGLGHSAP
jgi:hypothetical protein